MKFVSLCVVAALALSVEAKTEHKKNKAPAHKLASKMHRFHQKHLSKGILDDLIAKNAQKSDDEYAIQAHVIGEAVPPPRLNDKKLDSVARKIQKDLDDHAASLVVATPQAGGTEAAASGSASASAAASAGEAKAEASAASGSAASAEVAASTETAEAPADPFAHVNDHERHKKLMDSVQDLITRVKPLLTPVDEKDIKQAEATVKADEAATEAPTEAPAAEETPAPEVATELPTEVPTEAVATEAPVDGAATEAPVDPLATEVPTELPTEYAADPLATAVPSELPTEYAVDPLATEAPTEAPVAV